LFCRADGLPTHRPDRADRLRRLREGQVVLSALTLEAKSAVAAAVPKVRRPRSSGGC
jgi:hypothetical protein